MQKPSRDENALYNSKKVVQADFSLQNSTEIAIDSQLRDIFRSYFYYGIMQNLSSLDQPG